MLELEGNETRRMETHLYPVTILDKQDNIHKVACYGLPEIAKESEPPDQYNDFCRK